MAPITPEQQSRAVADREATRLGIVTAVSLGGPCLPRVANQKASAAQGVVVGPVVVVWSVASEVCVRELGV